MLSVMGEAGLQDHEEEGGGGGRHLGRGRAGQPRWILVFAPACSTGVCHWGVSVGDQGCLHLRPPSLPCSFGIHAPALEELKSPPPYQPVRDEGAALWRASSGLVPVPMGVLPFHLPCVLQVTPEILASASLLLFNCRSISAV